MEKRGDVLTPLLLAAAEARRYGDARDPDLAAYARREADALISAWVVEDRRDGRDCASVARLKRDRGWRAVDVLAFTIGGGSGRSLIARPVDGSISQMRSPILRPRGRFGGGWEGRTGDALKDRRLPVDVVALCDLRQRLPQPIPFGAEDRYLCGRVREVLRHVDVFFAQALDDVGGFDLASAGVAVDRLAIRLAKADHDVFVDGYVPLAHRPGPAGGMRAERSLGGGTNRIMSGPKGPTKAHMNRSNG